jgi:hypothetical protein
MEAGNRALVWTPEQQARSMKLGFIFGVGILALLVRLVGLLKLPGV